MAATTAGLLATGVAVASANGASEAASMTQQPLTVPTTSSLTTAKPVPSGADDDVDAATETAEPVEAEADGAGTPNPASVLKGENGFIHSEGRNSVGDARRDGLPKPERTTTGKGKGANKGSDKGKSGR
ncbi:MAG TPA: hypothetical protein P5193_00980 [Microthrixaceae bacterium]|nr:hypothetical protein [Microthrixaceae bacterium]